MVGPAVSEEVARAWRQRQVEIDGCQNRTRLIGLLASINAFDCVDAFLFVSEQKAHGAQKRIWHHWGVKCVFIFQK
jgi:hypothetical protein